MARKDPSCGIRNVIADLTKGKPYIFMIMSYNTHWHFYSLLRELVRSSVGLECIRADDIPGAGHDLLAKIHLLIDRAELVIAEITTMSPNVFYEVGYAVGNNKPLLLLIEENHDVPTDLKGREMIVYGGSRERMQVFEKNFREHLQSHLSSHVAILRDMLEAENPKPNYIATSPKYPQKGVKTHIPGQEYDYRTFGDNLGIVGLISAFGSILGEDSGVELVSAQYTPPDFLERPQNLYLIGSPKVNPWVGSLMESLQKGREPNWRFGAVPGQKEEGNYEVALYRTDNGKEEMVEGKSETGGPEGHVIKVMDHGLIMRGPHPHHPDRLAMIMAAPHILGTGAACMAATRSHLIKKINAALPDHVEVADKHYTMWALVRGEISRKDGLLDMEGVSILEAGIYQ